MITKNKYLWIFTTLLLASSLLAGGVIVKYLPILIHQTIDFCRVIIVGNTSKIFLAGIGTIGGLTLVKLGSMLWKMNIWGRELKALTVSIESSVVTFRGERPEAFCMGIFNPKIYISTGLIEKMEQDELATILRHEQYHLDHHDPLIFLIAYITQSLFPFFPFLVDLMDHYRTQREIMADVEASAHGNTPVLRRVLQKLIESEPQTEIALVPAISAHATLEARIKVLTGEAYKPKMLGWKRVVLSALMLVVIGVAIGIPIKVVETHNEGVDTINACYYTV